MFNFEDYYVGYTKSIQKTKKKNNGKDGKKLKQFAQMITNKQNGGREMIIKTEEQLNGSGSGEWIREGRENCIPRTSL